MDIIIMTRTTTMQGGKTDVKNSASFKAKQSAEIAKKTMEFLARNREIEVHESSYAFSGVADMRGE